MKILGIDPGLERIGFGLITHNTHKRYHALDWGVIQTSKADSDAKRLSGIYKALTSLLEDAKPDVVSIEQIFYCRNAKTIIPVTQARGVILMALHDAGMRYVEYTPMQVKLNMTGYGKATKQEIQQMVQQLLEMDELPRPDDAADGLALALSCAFEQGAISLLSPR